MQSSLEAEIECGPSSPSLMELDAICRVCLASSGPTAMTRIFASDGNNTETSLKIVQCAAIQLECDAQMPELICDECLNDLEVAFRFRNNCESSDAILRSYVETAALNEIVNNVAPADWSNSRLGNAEVAEQPPIVEWLPSTELNAPLDNASGECFAKTEVKSEFHDEQDDVEYRLVGELDALTAMAVAGESVKQPVDGDAIGSVDTDNVEEYRLSADDFDELLDSAVVGPIVDTMQEATDAIKSEAPEADDLSQFHEEPDSRQYVTVVLDPNDVHDEMDDDLPIIEEDPQSYPDDAIDEQQPAEHEPTPTAVDFPLDIDDLLVFNADRQPMATGEERQPEKEVFKTVATYRNRRNGKKGADNGESSEANAKHSQNSKVCLICGNRYKFQHSLDGHMRRHRNEKPFKCTICNKAFVINFELSRHMRTHTGLKPYPCAFCERRFADFGSRIKHERTHTGERPYPCAECGKSFAYSHVLASHMLTHSGQKKYCCTKCGKRFTKAHHLKAHNNTHIRQRLMARNPSPADIDATAESILQMAKASMAAKLAMEQAKEAAAHNNDDVDDDQPDELIHMDFDDTARLSESLLGHGMLSEYGDVAAGLGAMPLLPNDSSDSFDGGGQSAESDAHLRLIDEVDGIDMMADDGTDGTAHDEMLRFIALQQFDRDADDEPSPDDFLIDLSALDDDADESKAAGVHMLEFHC